MLVKFIGERKDLWEQFLDSCLYAYNTSRHESTHYSPYKLKFGRKPILPIDVDMNKLTCDAALQFYEQAKDISSTHVSKSAAEHHEVLTIAKKNVAIAQAKQKEQYDRKHCKPGLTFLCAIVHGSLVVNHTVFTSTDKI